MSDIELKVDALTSKLMKECEGNQAAEVLGAALNLIMTILVFVPDRDVVISTAAGLRAIADRIENESKH